MWAGTEADSLGRGGIAAVARATGLAISTVRAGRDEVKAGASVDDVVRVRRPGGGRPRLEVQPPDLLPMLESLVEPLTRGDPGSPLRWICKSVRTLSDELFALGYQVSPQKVSTLLRNELGYSLQGVIKTVEGTQDPDRNAQFEHINAKSKDCLSRKIPFISVDTKKKELVGNFKNAGAEWQPEGEPDRVDVHDFPSDAVGKAIPYGVYDVAANDGLVNVGTDHETPVFAVMSVKR